MKKKINAVILGALIIVIGLGLLGNGLFDWQLKLFFPGWWALALAVLCIVMIVNYGPEPWNVLGTCIFAFLFARYYIPALESVNLWASLGGCVVIYAGVQIITDACRGKKRVTAGKTTVTKDGETVVIEVTGTDKTDDSENK